jgi:RimJ/RimL family protein N-acetyltransferase
VVAVTTDGPEVALVARWMAEPHVASTWRQPWPVADWSAEIGRQLAGDHSRPWIVALDGEAVAYVEAYRVARDVIAEHHPTHAHDLGIHLAIGDVARTGRGLGARLLRVVAGGLLAADPHCRRVLGDPSVGHAAARAAFARAGFVPVADVDLGHKRAALMAHARADAPSPGGRP